MTSSLFLLDAKTRVTAEFVKETYGADVGCTEDGRNGRIGATRYAGGNGTRKEAESGTYNAGVKDLASAYVLCPRLAECGVFRFTDGMMFYGVTRGLGVEL